MNHILNKLWCFLGFHKYVERMGVYTFFRKCSRCNKDQYYQWSLPNLPFTGGWKDSKIPNIAIKE